MSEILESEILEKVRERLITGWERQASAGPDALALSVMQAFPEAVGLPRDYGSAVVPGHGRCQVSVVTTLDVEDPGLELTIVRIEKGETLSIELPGWAAVKLAVALKAGGQWVKDLEDAAMAREREEGRA
jgi:hypothetical protein